MTDNTQKPKLYLTSPMCPSVNHYLAYRGIMKNGKPMAVSYCTNEANSYKKWLVGYIHDEVKRQNWPLTPNKYQHFYVDTVFYFPRSDMDASNYFKVMLDAITDSHLIWLDDNVACERVQAIYYDIANPRIEICISPVDYIGVFSNAPQLELFESKCAECTRSARNCSLLRKAKEGKIQPEIVDGVCSEFKQKKEIKDYGKNEESRNNE